MILAIGLLLKSAVASVYDFPVGRMRLFTAAEYPGKSLYYNIVNNRFFAVEKRGLLPCGVLR